MKESEKSEPRLVAAFWQLKREFEKHFGVDVPLNRLMNDAEFLDATITEADRSTSLRLREAARAVFVIRNTQWTHVTIPATGVPPVSAPESIPSLPTRKALAERRGTSMFAGAAIVALLAGAAGSLIVRTSASQNAKPVSHEVAPSVAGPGATTIHLRIHGSNTVGEKLAPELVEAFLSKQGLRDLRAVPGIVPEEKLLLGNLSGTNGLAGIEIHAHGSGTAFKDLLAGTTDIGQSSRPIKPDEVGLLLPRLGDLTTPAAEHVIGLDAIAIIVHPSRNVTSLTVEQLARVFSGQIRDWTDLGAQPGGINVFARDDKSGTWDSFKSMVLDPHKLQVSEDAKRIESSSQLSDLVSSDPNAIGFIGLAYVQRAKLIGIAAEAGSEAIVPTTFTVATEDYPLSRRLYFYLSPQSTNPMARDLIEFAQSAAGQEIVKRVGFVSQNVYTERPVASASAPEKYRLISESGERLSVNFRFRPASEQLDSKSLRDLDRVVQFLGNHTQKRVTLLGFTDSSGDAKKNVELSARRAAVVEQALNARGIRPASVLGFGPAIAVASNSTEYGRDRNRRVEVWVE